MYKYGCFKVESSEMVDNLKLLLGHPIDMQSLILFMKRREYSKIEFKVKFI